MDNMIIDRFDSNYKPHYPKCTRNCNNCNYGFDKYVDGNSLLVVLCTNPHYSYRDESDRIMSPNSVCERWVERFDEDTDGNQSSNLYDEVQQSINERNQEIENFNKNFSNNDLNIFSKIMVSMAKFFMKVGYSRVSTAIPDKNKKQADAVVNALTESSKSFKPNEALTELLSETNHNSHKLLNIILLVIDAILTLSVLSLIGYGVYYFAS